MCVYILSYQLGICHIWFLSHTVLSGQEVLLETWYLIDVRHPASRAFLLLARFWHSRERLCMNRVRSLLNMRCMLPGYSLEPKPNMPDLAAILLFHGTAVSIITIGFVTKRTLALEKPV